MPDANPSTGFEIANAAIIDGIRSLGHSVTVFGFCQERQSIEAGHDTVVLDVRNLENSGADMAQKLKWLGQAVSSGLPVSAAKLVDYPVDTIIDLVGEKEPFDLHIFNSYQMAAAFPELVQAPSLFISHNVEWKSAEQNAASAENGFERFLYNRDARLLREIENQLCEQVDHVWFLSETDRNVLDGSGKNSSVLPLAALSTQSRPPQNPLYDLALIGTWTWKPNEIGLRWFLDEVLPKLDGQVSVALAGQLPDNLEVQDPRVTHLGRVPDAADFLNGAAIVPLIARSGTGIQLKTLEVFQMGLASVATPDSVRGIPNLPANCRLAHTSDDFADAVKDMLTQRKEGADLRLDGSQFAKRQQQAMQATIQQTFSNFHSASEPEITVAESVS